MTLIIHSVIIIKCSHPSIFVLRVYFYEKQIKLYFYFMLLQLHNSFVKTDLGLVLNNTPWYIAYAMVLGLEPKEFGEHSPKV